MDWGPAFQQKERELNDLYAVALREAERTGFPISDVERRLRNLQIHILAILLWPRDARPLSSEELRSREASGCWRGGPVADYLHEHTGRMMDAWKEVESLALRLEPGPESSTVAVSPSAAPLRQESSSANKVDVGIVVALEEEFRELVGQLAAPPRPALDEDTGRSFYLFERPSGDPKRPYRCVATFIGEMGHPKAALVTEKLVSSWAPATVAMLGIAGGIDKDVSVGDAVVAAVVDSYAERAKAVAGKGRRGFNLEFAGEVYRCSPDLINKLRHFEFSTPKTHQRWLEGCSERLEALIPEAKRTPLMAGKLLRPTAAVKVGHLASGPIVGTAQPFIDWLKKRDRSYLALEMEAGGLMAAVSEKADARRTLILRGISDYADERKAELDKLGDGILRRYAMQNVIRLLWALLESDTLPRNNL
jgi:nucleoside phosphorylase